VFNVFKEVLLPVDIHSTGYYLFEAIKRPMALLLYFEYALFAEHFIGLRERFPGMYRWVVPMKKTILVMIGVQLVIALGNWQYTGWGNATYYSFSIILFLAVVAFIIRIWNSSDRLVRFVLGASLAISIGGFISNVFILASGVTSSFSQDYYFLPAFIGAVFEIYFFNTGLAYKVSMGEKRLIETQKELITQLSEKESLLLAQQQIRNKLAQDLHDDIGATLSGIALHSHLAQEMMKRNNSESVARSLTVIQEGAVEMVNNLNDVVWTVNPKNDSVDQMLERLKEYAFKITEAKDMSVEWKVDEGVRELKLPMDARRNIFLICKEAINNAVKYSGSCKLFISGERNGEGFRLQVKDEGNGFAVLDVPGGNGLRNMKERANESGLDLGINSSEGGTSVSLFYKITQ
jgi:signal transduction histidine kinase